MYNLQYNFYVCVSGEDGGGGVAAGTGGEQVCTNAQILTYNCQKSHEILTKMSVWRISTKKNLKKK